MKPPAVALSLFVFALVFANVYALVRGLRALMKRAGALRMIEAHSKGLAVRVVVESDDLRWRAVLYASTERTWLSGGASHLDLERARAGLLKSAIDFERKMAERKRYEQELEVAARNQKDDTVSEQEASS